MSSDIQRHVTPHAAPNRQPWENPRILRWPMRA